ncbi:hypothetical protein VTJ04DRAFT_9898 [Mycothermus thermophilus]|uniref:uncharacterized protein n=1 Tax=Humicola insolens TaxID=85995 RepID=UPI003744734A
MNHKPKPSAFLVTPDFVFDPKAWEGCYIDGHRARFFVYRLLFCACFGCLVTTRLRLDDLSAPLYLSHSLSLSLTLSRSLSRSHDKSAHHVEAVHQGRGRPGEGRRQHSADYRRWRL